MLVGLAKKVVVLISRLRSFGEYFESSFQGKVIFVAFALVFFAISSILFNIFAALMFNFPKTWATLILICFLVPTIVLFSVPFMKTVSDPLFSLPFLKTSSGVPISFRFLKATSNGSAKCLVGKNAELCIGATLIALLGLYASIGIGVFSGSEWMPKVLRHHIDSSRFPLGTVSGFDIDGEGRIYIANQDYSRIQVYDSGGKFLNGWHVPSGYGIFNMWVKDNELTVVTVRTDKRLVYDNSGRLLVDEDIDPLSSYKNLSKHAAGVKEKHVNEDRYLLSSQKWFPSIIKVSSDKVQSVVVVDPLYITVISQKRTAICVVLCFMFLYVILVLVIYFNVNLK